MCLRCGSNQVRFVFEDNFRGGYDVKCLIKEKKVRLSDEYEDYANNPEAVKWICYNCYDCGIVL